MRHLLSVLVIAFSISALLGGYLSGRAAVPRFPQSPATSAAQRAGDAPLVLETPQTDEVAEDRFAGDAAVAMNPAGGGIRSNAHLALVLVDAGHSMPLEAPFLELHEPIALVVDPSGPATGALVHLARQDGAPVYLQVRAPLDASAVRLLRQGFPGARGIAMRVKHESDVPADALAQLRRSRFALFDEYGALDGASARFTAAGIPYTARGITIDDHAQRSYVAFMLRQAVHLARGGTAVVMVRPFPETLQALEDELVRAARDGVHFVSLK